MDYAHIILTNRHTHNPSISFSAYHIKPASPHSLDFQKLFTLQNIFPLPCFFNFYVWLSSDVILSFFDELQWLNHLLQSWEVSLNMTIFFKNQDSASDLLASACENWNDLQKGNWFLIKKWFFPTFYSLTSSILSCFYSSGLSICVFHVSFSSMPFTSQILVCLVTTNEQTNSGTLSGQL